MSSGKELNMNVIIVTNGSSSEIAKLVRETNKPFNGYQSDVLRRYYAGEIGPGEQVIFPPVRGEQTRAVNA